MYCRCSIWFAKLRADNLDVEDAPRAEKRSRERYSRGINWCIPTGNNSGDHWDVSNSTFHDLLKRLGFSSKLYIWVLTKRNLCRRVDFCDLLLNGQENDLFLKRIISTDNKWIIYNNAIRKNSWSKKVWIALVFGGILKESFFFTFTRNTQRNGGTTTRLVLRGDVWRPNH